MQNVEIINEYAATGNGREEKGLRKHFKIILLLLFTIFIFWFFGRNLDWQEVSASLRKGNPWYLISAVLIISTGYLLRAIRWKVLLAPITESSLKELFATTTVGYAAIFLVGRAGEIVRPMWLPMRDHRVRPSAALVTLGLERIFDMAALTCFFAFNLLWFTPQPGREAEFAFVEVAGWLMLAGIALGFAALIVFQRISDRVIDWTERVTGRFPARLQKIFISILRQLSSALSMLRDWRETLVVSLWTLSLWLAIAVPTWFVLLAFDMPFTFSESLFIMGIASVSSIIPTPGGAAGAFHTGTGLAIVFLNNTLRTEDVAAVAIAMHLVYFAPAVFFGLYYFVHGDISIERFRRLLSSENAEREIESDSPDFVPET